MLGLFVQRHAEALSSVASVAVLYLQPEDRQEGKRMEAEVSNERGVLTCRIYYRNPFSSIPGLGQVLKGYWYLMAFRKGMKVISSEEFKPDINHVHILTRAGVPALWMKWTHDIPYVITEHWSRYLPSTGTYRGMLRKWLTRLVVRNSKGVSTVTKNLADAMQAHGLVHAQYNVIPNVVDTGLFIPTEKTEENTVRHLVHISVFEDRSKNISGMLECIARVCESRKDFRVSMVGEGMDLDRMKALAISLGLVDRVDFTGLLEGASLASLLGSADLLMLFSNYENIPVVINEAMACGVPTLATRVGGIPEYLESYAGRMVEAADKDAFTRAVIDFLDEKWETDSERMRNKALEAFSMDAVATQFIGLYNEILMR